MSPRPLGKAAWHHSTKRSLPATESMVASTSWSSAWPPSPDSMHRNTEESDDRRHHHAEQTVVCPSTQISGVTSTVICRQALRPGRVRQVIVECIMQIRQLASPAVDKFMLSATRAAPPPWPATPFVVVSNMHVITISLPDKLPDHPSATHDVRFTNSFIVHSGIPERRRPCVIADTFNTPEPCSDDHIREEENIDCVSRAAARASTDPSLQPWSGAGCVLGLWAFLRRLLRLQICCYGGVPL